jgi:3-oxoacyl-[acyl-carrier-protein] synthase III
MTMGHTERLLLADTDPQAALEFRSQAEEELRLRERTFELYEVVGDPVPERELHAMAQARIQVKELNRVVLHHAARRVDAAKRAQGLESEMESAVMLFDIENPVVLAG